MSGAPFDSIRRQLGANRAAISGGYTRTSLGIAGSRVRTVVLPAEWLPFARVNEGEGIYLRLVITTCVAFGVVTCSAH
jgi:hypothetical protein